MNRRRFLMYMLITSIPVKLVRKAYQLKVIKDARGRWYL